MSNKLASCDKMHIFHSFNVNLRLHILFLGRTQPRNALHCETDRLQDCKYFYWKLFFFSSEVLSGVLDKKTWRCHPIGRWYACEIWWKDWNWEKILFVSVEFENKVSFFLYDRTKRIFYIATRRELLIFKLWLIFDILNLIFSVRICRL